jgi:transcriptional regulator with XRE-family HTH domain
MNNILSIKQNLSRRVIAARKRAKLSQNKLAEKSGVSLGSIKRFENKNEISLTSLLKIALVLGYENDFEQLFSRKNYQSIEEVINEQ